MEEAQPLLRAGLYVSSDSSYGLPTSPPKGKMGLSYNIVYAIKVVYGLVCLVLPLCVEGSVRVSILGCRTYRV